MACGHEWKLTANRFREIGTGCYLTAILSSHRLQPTPFMKGAGRRPYCDGQMSPGSCSERSKQIGWLLESLQNVAIYLSRQPLTNMKDAIALA